MVIFVIYLLAKQICHLGDFDVATFHAIREFFNFDLSPIFTLNRDERLRRHNWRLKKDFKTKIRKNCLPNRVFDHWNGLSTEIVNSTTVNFSKNNTRCTPQISRPTPLKVYLSNTL
jgi:hypothetical protein